MRTLKKTLCFVLALVMVLGMGAFGVYAESTTSASTGDYTEASKVTEAIGVFIGGDGTDWSTPLTRAQAATLLCRLDGKTDDEINAMTISNTFTDLDPWAEPFVAYAEREGLILGVGGGRFDPQGALTGYQWALMLLRALGYTDAGEGINSDNWQVITARLSRQAGLDKNIEDMSAQLSREEGAQMVYNALKADMMEYNNGVTVTTDSSTSVNVSGSRKERTTSNSWGSDIDNKTDSNGKYIIQLGESLFKGDLQLANDERDAFGRPDCDTWKYKGKEIVTLAASDEHLVATHIGKVEYKDLYADLGDTVVTSLKNNWISYIGSNAFVDGVQTYTLDETKLTRSNGDAILNTGNGSYTEVYNKYDSELKAYKVTVVVINTYLGKVSGNYNSSKGELVISTETSPGALDSYKLSSSDISGLDGFSDKDYILYTCALVQDSSTTKKWEVKNVYAPTVLEDVKVSSFKIKSNGTDADSVTVDGSTYKYSQWRSEDSTFKTLSTSYETTGDFTYDIYLDENDFVVYAEGHSAAGRYVYVESTNLELKFSNSEITLQAKAVNLEGIKSTVTISKIDGKSVRSYLGTTAINNHDASVLDGEWFRYNVDTDGKYRLIPLSGATVNADVSLAASDEFNKTLAIATAKKNVAGTSLTTDKNKLYFDNATIFVVYDSVGDVYHAYTGITNLPDITNADLADAAVKTINNHVSYMYIRAKSVTDSGNVKWAFIRTKEYNESSNTNGKTTYTYSAVMENDEGTVDVFDITLGDKIEQAGLYYWYTTKDGMPNNLIRVDDDNKGGGHFNYQEETSAKTITYADGTVSCNGKAWPVNSAAQSWKIKNDDGSYKGGDAEKLGLSTIVNNDYYNKFMGEIFVVYKSGNDKTITQIFFMYDGEPKESSTSSTASTDLTYVGIDGKSVAGTYYLYYYVEAGGTVGYTTDDVLALLSEAGYPYAAYSSGKYDLSDSLKGMTVTPVQVYKVTVDGTVYYIDDGIQVNDTKIIGKQASVVLDKDGEYTNIQLKNSVAGATGVLITENGTDAYDTLTNGKTVGKNDVSIKTNYSTITNGKDANGNAFYEAGKAVTLTPTTANKSAQKVTGGGATKYYDLKNGTIKIAADDFEGDITLSAIESFTYNNTKYYGAKYSTATLADNTAALNSANNTAAKNTYVVAVTKAGAFNDVAQADANGKIGAFATDTVADEAVLKDGYYLLISDGAKFQDTTGGKIAKTTQTTLSFTSAYTCDESVLKDANNIYAPAGATVTITLTPMAAAGADDATVTVTADNNASVNVSTNDTNGLVEITGTNVFQYKNTAPATSTVTVEVTMASAGANTTITFTGA